MTKKLKNKSALSTYQSLYDEDILVREILSEGSADLMFHLQFFKKRLSGQIKNQQKKFDNIFFEKIRFDDIPSVDEHSDIVPVKNKERKNRSKDPGWVKVLYRKIVMLTHPDKTSAITLDKIREKLNKQYLITIDAVNEAKYENVAMIANQLDLLVPDEAIEGHVIPKSETLKKEIRSNKTQIGYQWYYVKEEEKKKALKDYLHNLGFVFTEEDIEVAIKHGRTRVKRKPGVRPVNLLRKRMRIK